MVKFINYFPLGSQFYYLVYILFIALLNKGRVWIKVCPGFNYQAPGSFPRE